MKEIDDLEEECFDFDIELTYMLIGVILGILIFIIAIMTNIIFAIL